MDKEKLRQFAVPIILVAVAFLAGEYRGRCGSDFKDFASGSPLETSCCVICSKSDKPMFGINFPDFE